MSYWEEFEIECTDYLNQKFGRYAKFFHQGGADSTVPDILAKTRSGNSFYIDAKHSPAQCGQFVLLPCLENRTFEYSRQNVNRINQYTQMIMEFMDGDFDAFREAGTAGKDIDMPYGSLVFSNWIIQTYQDKGVEFFITNNYTILPIEQFSEYFEVTAKYRIKRSGSGNVGRSRIMALIDYVNSHDYNITAAIPAGEKLFVTSSQYLHNRRFLLYDTEYMFSLRGNRYEIRRLSNTYNANVIFSIKQRAGIPGMADYEFIDCLKM